MELECKYSGFFFVLSCEIIGNNLNIMKIIFLITPRYLVTEIVLQTFYNGVKKNYY